LIFQNTDITYSPQTVTGASQVTDMIYQWVPLTAFVDSYNLNWISHTLMFLGKSVCARIFQAPDQLRLRLFPQAGNRNPCQPEHALPDPTLSALAQ
jgi:hypothetical protein